LNVSIVPLKDTVARGDSQCTTITVTDSASRPVANAEIDGILKYLGDNFEKELPTNSSIFSRNLNLTH